MITLDKVGLNNDTELAIDISNFKLLPYGIFYLNYNRQITFWNDACEALTGFNINDINGIYCHELNMCKNKCLVNENCNAECPVLKSMEENLFINTKFSLKKKDGTDIQVCGYITPVKNSAGYVNGAIVFFKKDNEYERIYQLNKELVMNREAKHELLTVVSHDLRTPLASLLCYFSVFFDNNSENLTDKQKLVLKNMKKVCISMLRMLNSILDVTAIETGKLSLSKSKVNIKEVLDINLINSKFMADQKNIDIKIEIETDLPEIELDKNKFQQVVDNLISNAVKFSYPNSSIVIEVSRMDNDMLITVKDQGQGIPENELNTIFEPYKTSSVKPTGKESSNGIGLSIVKKIVELHNGFICVESQLKEGTTFKIRLPF